jgi:hypothetical protein
MPPKKLKQSNEIYCVLQSNDGARIMDIEAANAYVDSSGSEVRDSTTLHYAGKREDAVKLMKQIEAKHRDTGSKFNDISND